MPILLDDCISPSTTGRTSASLRRPTTRLSYVRRHQRYGEGGPLLVSPPGFPGRTAVALSTTQTGQTSTGPSPFRVEPRQVLLLVVVGVRVVRNIKHRNSKYLWYRTMYRPVSKFVITTLNIEIANTTVVSHDVQACFEVCDHQVCL